MSIHSTNNSFGFGMPPLVYDQDAFAPSAPYADQNAFSPPVTYPTIISPAPAPSPAPEIEKKVYIHDFIAQRAKGCSVSHSGFQALITVFTIQACVMLDRFKLPIILHLAAAIFGHACIRFQNSGSQINTYRKIQDYLNTTKAFQGKANIELSDENVRCISTIIEKNNPTNFNSQLPYQPLKDYLNKANTKILDNTGTYTKIVLIY